MRSLRIVRRLSALVLLAALFLPLSRCSQSSDAGQSTQPVQPVQPMQPAEPRQDLDEPLQTPSQPATYKYFYAWTDFQAGSAGSWLIFLAFLWPIPFLAYEWTHRDRRAPIWLPAAQLPLAAGAILLVYYRTFLNELWIGGYLAYIALGCLTLALLAEIGIRVVDAVRARRAPGGAQDGARGGAK